jgi:hypothetical protein
LGITRFGVAKMKDSVLMLASFEKTTDHLFDASAFGRQDDIAGVSESIIMGNPAANCGTSMYVAVLFSVHRASSPLQAGVIFATTHHHPKKKTTIRGFIAVVDMKPRSTVHW